MTTTPIAEGEALRRACRDLGLGDGVADALLARLLGPLIGADVQAVERMARREAEMMELLKTPTPDKLIHDLRNLLNEVTLLKAAAEM